MASFFEKRDPWGHGFALWVVVAMAFVVPPALWSVSQVDLENDVASWLPADNPEAQRLRWYQSLFPSEDRIIASWEGSALDDPRLPVFVKALEGVEVDGERIGGSPYVDQVFTPRDAIRPTAKALRGNYREGGIDEAETDELRREILRRFGGVLIGSHWEKLKLTEAGLENKRQTLAKLKDRARAELDLTLEYRDPLNPETAFPSDEELAEVRRTILPPDLPRLDENSPTEPNQDADEDAELESLVDAILSPNRPPHDVMVRWPSLGLPIESGDDADDDPETQKLTAFRELATELRSEPTEDHPEGVPLIETVAEAPGVGVPVAAIISLTEAGREDRGAALNEIRRIAGELGISESSLKLGGRPVAGHELNASVERVGWNPEIPGWQFWNRSPFLLSMALGVLLTLIMLRDLRLSILVIAVAIYTMLISTALVPVTGGSMNMILVVMPTLLMVLTISAAIHVANYWKHAAGARPDAPAGAVVDAVRMARMPCLLASVTTAIGLASLTTSPLVPVRDFGVYSAIGCLLALLVVLYGLPALLLYWPGRTKPEKGEDDRCAWRWFGRGIAGNWGKVSLLCTLAFVVCSIGLKNFRTETKAIRYFPDDTKIVSDYNYLESMLSGIVPVDVVVKFTPDANSPERFAESTLDPETDADRMFELLQPKIDAGEIEPIGEGDDPVEYLYSLADDHPEVIELFIVREPVPLELLERLEIVREIEERMRRHPEISGTLSLADFRPVTVPPADGAPLEAKAYTTRQNAFAEAIRDPDASARGFYRLVDEDSQLSDKGDEVWKITAQVAIMSDANYGDLTAELDRIVDDVTEKYPGADHVVTGMVPVFLETQQAVLDSLIRSFGLAFGIIAIVMMILLRNPLSGLLTMLPNLLPVGVVFGLISWAGLRVDIGTMITASVALGIAVDGTLHLLTWFRDGLRRGLSRADAVALSMTHCGPAMWQTSATVGLGLLVLAFADILLVSRFGWLMASLIGSALIADLIFLPALLAGPLGALIERNTSPGPLDPAEDISEAADLADTVRQESEQEAESHPEPAAVASGALRVKDAS